jgi:hypothetical protein
MTWEFMNKLIKGNEVTDDKVALYAGTITPEIAAQFTQFTKVFKDLVTVKEILNDPMGAMVSNDTSTRWATICAMMEKVDDQNFDGLSTYANRYPLDFRVLFFRSTMARNPRLVKHPAFSRSALELSKYLHAA